MQNIDRWMLINIAQCMYAAKAFERGLLPQQLCPLLQVACVHASQRSSKPKPYSSPAPYSGGVCPCLAVSKQARTLQQALPLTPGDTCSRLAVSKKPRTLQQPWPQLQVACVPNLAVFPSKPEPYSTRQELTLSKQP